MLAVLFVLREYRSSALEQSLRKLGVEKLNKDDVQKMQWEVLEAKIGNWIHFMRIAVRDYCYLHYLFYFYCLNFFETGQTSICRGEKSL